LGAARPWPTFELRGTLRCGATIPQAHQPRRSALTCPQLASMPTPPGIQQA